LSLGRSLVNRGRREKFRRRTKTVHPTPQYDVRPNLRTPHPPQPRKRRCRMAAQSPPGRSSGGCGGRGRAVAQQAPGRPSAFQPPVAHRGRPSCGTPCELLMVLHPRPKMEAAGDRTRARFQSKSSRARVSADAEAPGAGRWEPEVVHLRSELRWTPGRYGYLPLYRHRGLRFVNGALGETRSRREGKSWAKVCVRASAMQREKPRFRGIFE
jgi:hypothetical protein